MDDVAAVMEAIGSKRAAQLGYSEGASMSVLFAATYPERTSHLILCGGMAKFTNASDYEFMFSEEVILKSVKYWGSGAFIHKEFYAESGKRPCRGQSVRQVRAPFCQPRSL
jgi:pimeloyl-ACP methyl ester carboxylesterase